MPMMDWYTAGASAKQKPSGPNFKPDWQNATWICIRRKTKIVYCKDAHRKETYPNVKFDFLGYCFRPRWVKRMRGNTMFCGFYPAVSPAGLKTMRSTIRDLGIRHRTQMSLADIALQINPLLRAWIEYYGRYAPSALAPVLR